MKIYTRQGDSGLTGLYGGGRVRKDSLRIEAYGTVDELNAVLGVARTASLPQRIDSIIERLQSELFDLGGELATVDPAAHGTRVIGERQTARMEAEIDEAETVMAPLKTFILPGGTPAAAALHLARTVCRRAERLVVQLAADPAENVAAELVVYLNRLSDLLFVLARLANCLAGQADVPWRKSQ